MKSAVPTAAPTKIAVVVPCEADGPPTGDEFSLAEVPVLDAAVDALLSAVAVASSDV